MKRAIATGSAAVAARIPGSVRRRLGPGTRYLNMLFVDHLWVRLAYTNRRKLAEGVWRSAQPLPHQIHRMSQQGIRTIVNLRGRTRTSTYEHERAACARYGVTLIDFPMKSRGAPTRAVILAAHDLLDKVERPFLMHCKSGADRAGLMSVLYLHVKQGVPMVEAKKQLSLRYGHVRHADTGILDEVFERYLADTAVRPIGFMEWVETVYDADELQRSFKAKGWANRIVRGMLKRE